MSLYTLEGSNVATTTPTDTTNTTAPVTTPAETPTTPAPTPVTTPTVPTTGSVPVVAPTTPQAAPTPVIVVGADKATDEHYKNCNLCRHLRIAEIAAKWGLALLLLGLAIMAVRKSGQAAVAA